MREVDAGREGGAGEGGRRWSTRSTDGAGRWWRWWWCRRRWSDGRAGRECGRGCLKPAQARVLPNAALELAATRRTPHGRCKPSRTGTSGTRPHREHARRQGTLRPPLNRARRQTTQTAPSPLPPRPWRRPRPTHLGVFGGRHERRRGWGGAPVGQPPAPPAPPPPRERIACFDAPSGLPRRRNPGEGGGGTSAATGEWPTAQVPSGELLPERAALRLSGRPTRPV